MAECFSNQSGYFCFKEFADADKNILSAINQMDLTEYKNAVESIPYGKRLPTALYVVRDNQSDFGPEMNKLLSQIVSVFEIGSEFNVLKFRTNDLKVSFLSYPDFFEIAHPSLRKAVTVDLRTGKARHTDYANNLNPPILHRKECFIPVGHPLRNEFEKLTSQEESAGLYEKTETIGFKLNWERLLTSKGLALQGHSLCRSEDVDESTNHVADNPEILRHKTALKRYNLSKPVKSLFEFGLIKKDTTLFDYGCGMGSDVRGLQALGYQADGWDPVYTTDGLKREADIVNLGYVLNVIEDPAERLETLVDAFRHSNRLLVVSALINETVESSAARLFQDGVVTQRNTFQKFFDQQELQQFLEDALDVSAVPVSLGVFYIFRNPNEEQDFLSARSRRIIDWNRISARLGMGRPQTLWKSLYEQYKELLDAFGRLTLELGRIPESTEYEGLAEISERLGSPKRALRAYVQGGGAEGVNWEEIRVRFGIGQPPKRRWEALYEENRELLEGFWSLLLQLGRLPEPEEYPQTVELREKVGSPKFALRIFVQKGGGEEVRRAAENRKGDLLVYVALANLRKKVPFGHLSQSLRFDIREFFGNYTNALQTGMELLYAAGDMGEIELACGELKLGWQDEQALYFHRSVLDEMPPVLRAYVGCATALFGDVSQTDVIKLHRSSGKVTFLGYDDFEGKPLPELRNRIKVNLRTRWVQVFDHSADGQLLYFKERFVAPNHPLRAEMEIFSAKLRKLGLSDTLLIGPMKAGFAGMLEKAGLNENLNKRRR